MRKPPIGTRSLLWGVHQVIIHPMLVALAWWRVYGFRRVTCPASRLTVSLLDPRLWLVFLVHDWGYWGCGSMDGPDGKWHPALGARIVSRVLRERNQWRSSFHHCMANAMIKDGWDREVASSVSWKTNQLGPWGRLSIFHSRSVARRFYVTPSALCAPDKLAVLMYPRPLYLVLGLLSGEIWEYMRHADTEAGKERGLDASTPWRWLTTIRAYMRQVVDYLVAGEDSGVPPEDARLLRMNAEDEDAGV